MKTPYFVLSKKVILEQYNKVMSLADLISYSSKTNQEVTTVLEKETECLFSVHLKNELKHVKDLSRVIFLVQGWTEAEVSELVNKGIIWFVVDNEIDLDILLNFIKKNNVKLNVLLRLKLKERSIRTEKYYVFGMGYQTIEQRIKDIQDDPDLKNKIDKLGIHFHRKTQNLSEWKLQYELSNSFSDEFWNMINTVNIGGGLPSVYANTNVKVFDGIFKKIQEFVDWLHSQNIKVIIEPGRFIAAPAGKLITKIISIHESTIIVNASVYNGDLDALIVPVKLLVEGELEKDDGKAYIIKGITPCSMDIFRYRVYLKEPQVGDLLVFLNAGAYNFSSDFCDMEKLQTKIE